jgi:hypothetical protein
MAWAMFALCLHFRAVIRRLARSAVPRLDQEGEVIGIAIVNAKWLLERDGKINVTVPSLIETNTDDLAQALADRTTTYDAIAAAV